MFPNISMCHDAGNPYTSVAPGTGTASLALASMPAASRFCWSCTACIWLEMRSRVHIWTAYTTAQYSCRRHGAKTKRGRSGGQPRRRKSLSPCSNLEAAPLLGPLLPWWVCLWAYFVDYFWGRGGWLILSLLTRWISLYDSSSRDHESKIKISRFFQIFLL